MLVSNQGRIIEDADVDIGKLLARITVMCPTLIEVVKLLEATNKEASVIAVLEKQKLLLSMIKDMVSAMIKYIPSTSSDVLYLKASARSAQAARANYLSAENNANVD
jgi:hypothetical protein